jgi:DNA-binding winged helix-turn-helix (wHTH) protein
VVAEELHKNCRSAVSKGPVYFTINSIKRMTLTGNRSYEFSGFTLNVDERVLLYLNERVELTGKDFDVLHFLLRHPKRLVRNTELIAGVWGEGSQMVERGLNNHIARVRKALGCDPRFPTFIETVRGKGYRLIADVNTIENDHLAPSVNATVPDEYLVSSHLFVPIYLGAGVFEENKGDLKESPWVRYRESPLGEGRLCILHNGIAVWHLTKTMRFQSMSVVARWRRQIYDEILDEKSGLTKHIEKLIHDVGSRSGSILPNKIGKPGYVLSAMLLESPRWSNIHRIKNAVRLLSSLTPLDSKLKRKKEEERALERRILEDGFVDPEMREFGVRGRDIGFASWDGVSYFSLDSTSSGIMHDLIEFEIAVQATWWFAKCLSDEMMTYGKSLKARLGDEIEALQEMFARVESIGPRETPSQRTMIEAILHTSRVERLVRETIRQQAGR